MEVAELAANGDRACARKRDGSVVCWGVLASTLELAAPRPVPLAASVQLAGTCSRTAAAGVECVTPQAQVVAIAGVRDALDVAATSRSGCAVVRGGTVRCWRTPDEPALAIAGVRGAVQVAVGRDFGCARLAGGGVQCWPWDEPTHVVESPSMAIAAPPRRSVVRPRPARAVFAPVLDATSIVASDWGACAVRRAGRVECWALPGARGLDADLVAATRALRDVRQLALGASHGCALTTAGELRCWGQDTSGELGNGWSAVHPTPVTVPGLRDVVEVSANQGGEPRTCARTGDGRVHCWGNTARSTTSAAVRDLGVASATSITANWLIAVIDGHGALWNVYLRDRPELLPMPPARQVSGECAVTIAGELWCYGNLRWDNSGAHLGDPVRVPGITDAVEVSAPDDSHACVRRASGEVVCYRPQHPLEVVPGLADAIAIGVGRYTACAVRADHTVGCWHPVTMYGDLGGSRAPVAVPGLSGVVALSVGGELVCAVKSDGTVACWGGNDEGQLGDGTTISRDHPAPVQGLHDAIAVSAGSTHACALRRTGEVACWGSTASGELGTYATGSIAAPVAVVWP